MSEENKIKRDIYCIAGFRAMNLFLFTMEIFFFSRKNGQLYLKKKLALYNNVNLSLKKINSLYAKWRIDLDKLPRLAFIKTIIKNFKFWSISRNKKESLVIEFNEKILNEILESINPNNKIRFVYPQMLFKNKNISDEVSVDQLINTFFYKVLGNLEISVKELEILFSFFKKNISEIFLIVMKNYSNFKLDRTVDEVWASSAGKYSSRMIGLILKSNNKGMNRITHGNPIGFLLRDTIQIELIEMIASSKIYLPSYKFKKLAEQNFSEKKLSLLNCNFNYIRKKNGRSKKKFVKSNLIPKRVLFAPTLLRGVFQYFKPMFPDSIIFSLQKDIFKTLKRSNLHIDYLPHPEGIIPKKHHPLLSNHKLSETSFEEVYKDYDIIVFDYILSSISVSALCSDKPIIFFDVYKDKFQKEFQKELQNRCKIIDCSYKSNRVLFDNDHLLNHILSIKTNKDGFWFRELYNI